LKRQEKRKGKKLIYVPESLLEEMMEAARKEGKSLTSMVEEALEQALQTRKMGYNPNEALEHLRVLRSQKILGGAYIPQDVLNHLMSHIDDGEKMQNLKLKWHECGAWHGNYLKEEFKDPVKAFKTFLETMRWDLNEIKLEEEDKKVKLRIASTTLTIEETNLLLEYVKAALTGMGLEIQSCNHMRGLLIIEAKRT